MPSLTRSHCETFVTFSIRGFNVKMRTIFPSRYSTTRVFQDRSLKKTSLMKSLPSTTTTYPPASRPSKHLPHQPFKTKSLISEFLSLVANNVRQMRDGKQRQSPLILGIEIVCPSSSLGQHQMSQQRQSLCDTAALITFN